MVEHPEFEGHVTLNEDEYQKSVRLKFTDIVSEYRKPSSVFWLRFILAEETDFEIGHFHNYRLGVKILFNDALRSE